MHKPQPRAISDGHEALIQPLDPMVSGAVATMQPSWAHVRLGARAEAVSLLYGRGRCAGRGFH